MLVFVFGREMRLVGSSKQSKPHSVLRLVDGSSRPEKDAVITWLDETIQTITVPLTMPPVMKRGLKVHQVTQASSLVIRYRGREHSNGGRKLVPTSQR